MNEKGILALVEHGILGALVVVFISLIVLLWRADQKRFKEMSVSHKTERERWLGMHIQATKELTETGRKEVEAINNLAVKIEYLAGRTDTRDAFLSAKSKGRNGGF